MDWNLAIEKNREALKRILAMLVAMGVAGGGVDTPPASPRHPAAPSPPLRAQAVASGRSSGAAAHHRCRARAGGRPFPAAHRQAKAEVQLRSQRVRHRYRAAKARCRIGCVPLVPKRRVPSRFRCSTRSNAGAAGGIRNSAACPASASSTPSTGRAIRIRRCCPPTIRSMRAVCIAVSKRSAARWTTCRVRRSASRAGGPARRAKAERRRRGDAQARKKHKPRR